MHSMFGEMHIKLQWYNISFVFFPFFAFAMQLFSTLATSSNLRNQAPLFTELCLLQATRGALCHIGLVKDRGIHLVNQPRLSFLTSVEKQQLDIKKA